MVKQSVTGPSARCAQILRDPENDLRAVRIFRGLDWPLRCSTTSHDTVPEREEGVMRD